MATIKILEGDNSTLSDNNPQIKDGQLLLSRNDNETFAIKYDIGNKRIDLDALSREHDTDIEAHENLIGLILTILIAINGEELLTIQSKVKQING
jgi:hypothetical protein